MERSAVAFDFYRQLGLLLESEMPLPDGIGQLAVSFRRGAFKRVLRHLEARCAAGEPLSVGMAEFPAWFAPQYVGMVEVGERSGTLSRTLLEIGRAAEVDSQITAQFRTILCYPGVVTLAAMLVAFGLFNFVIAPQIPLFLELGGEQGLTPATRALLGVTEWIREWRWGLVGFFGIWTGYFIFLMRGSAAATRQLLAVLRFLPGFRGIFRQLSDARLCLFWGLMLGRGVPERALFAMLAHCLGNAPQAEAIRLAAEALERGVPVAETLGGAKAVSPLIALCCGHAGERALAEELGKLAELFLRQAMIRVQTVGAIWETTMILLVAAGCAWLTVALFAPFEIMLNFWS